MPPQDPRFVTGRQRATCDLHSTQHITSGIAMKYPRRVAAALLLAGAVLAVGTPGYIAHAAPNLAGYLLHPALFLGQLAPFLLCAALWLPWRPPAAAATTVVLASLLLLASVILYGPMLWSPAKHGGDMIGLAFVAISAGMTAGLLVASAVACLVLWMRLRAARRQDRRRMAA
jgi:hypothetical protein